MSETAKIIDIYYLCDGKKCVNCSKQQGLCYHTSDLSHAVNREHLENSLFCYSTYIGDENRAVFMECAEES